MKDLIKFKYCLIKDFVVDDNYDDPDLIDNNFEYTVYHKKYRKGLE